MKKKAFRITISVKQKGFAVEDPEKIAAFGQRLNESMKEVRLEYKKKAILSAERASQIVLNA